MNTTVRNMMLGLVLMGGLTLSVPVSAQMSSNRQRTSAARGANTTVQRSGSDSRQRQSAGAPQGSVRSRGTDNSRSSGATVSRSSSAQRDNTRSRGTSTGAIRSNRERPSSQVGTTRSSATHSDRNDNRGTGDLGRGRDATRGGGNVTPGRGDNNRSGGGNVTPGRDNNRGGGGNITPGRGDNNRGGGRDNRGSYTDNRGRNGGGDHRGYGPNDRNGHTRPYNYDAHPHRDHFSWNYSHHNWSRPLPPPHRPYRPAPLRYRRPILPAHYRPYHGAPVIDRILGITFGTLFDATLDYLYGNGYYIDGYADNVVYLRDVRMLNMLWPDAMLCYDGGRLANAQFVYMTNYNDRSRYNRIYHDLSAVYGPPISVESGLATWFGGNTTGYVTLSLGSDYGRYYTTLSVGY